MNNKNTVLQAQAYKNPDDRCQLTTPGVNPTNKTHLYVKCYYNTGMPQGKIKRCKRNSVNMNPACLPKTSPLA